MHHAFSAEDQAVVILMYHDVVADGHRGAVPGDALYDVELRAFETQMRILREEDHQVLSLARFVAHQRARKPLPPRSIIITFDDGFASCHHRALPVLLEQGLAAEFFLTVDRLDKPGYMTWNHARTLVDSGMGIGSHLFHHVYLDDLESTLARQELTDSKETLEGNLRTPVDFLAPPGGRITHEVEKMAVEIGYRGICNSKIGVNRLDQDPFRLCRVPIVRSTGPDTFRAIVDQHPSTMRFQQTRLWILDLAKRILGNRRYDRIRDRLLARHDVG